MATSKLKKEKLHLDMLINKIGNLQHSNVLHQSEVVDILIAHATRKAFLLYKESHK